MQSFILRQIDLSQTSDNCSSVYPCSDCPSSFVLVKADVSSGVLMSCKHVSQ